MVVNNVEALNSSAPISDGARHSKNISARTVTQLGPECHQKGLVAVRNPLIAGEAVDG